MVGQNSKISLWTRQKQLFCSVKQVLALRLSVFIAIIDRVCLGGGPGFHIVGGECERATHLFVHWKIVWLCVCVTVCPSVCPFWHIEHAHEGNTWLAVLSMHDVVILLSLVKITQRKIATGMGQWVESLKNWRHVMHMSAWAWQRVSETEKRAGAEKVDFNIETVSKKRAGWSKGLNTMYSHFIDRFGSLPCPAARKLCSLSGWTKECGWLA